MLEPQLLACLGPWVERLIMIGDHKQLRPQVSCHNLVLEKHFDVSLFERLVNNGIPHAALITQCRMRHEFVPLLKQIYPAMRTNEIAVANNIAPECVAKSMFFWTHRDPENLLTGTSVSNIGECKRVAALVLYMIQQGYQPGQVTVLASYQGQVTLLRKAIEEGIDKVWSNHEQIIGKRIGKINGRVLDEEVLLCKAAQYLRGLLKELHIPVSEHEENKVKMVNCLMNASSQAECKVAVHTIDQFQGDQNEVVIVSLVRSNAAGNVGFLGTLNRYCVAVSRSRCGLYFVGNEKTLCSARGEKSKHWKHMVKEMGMSANGGIGPKIPLVCPRHPGSITEIEKADDIFLEDGGICKVKCGMLMSCGTHFCNLRCHYGESQHKYCKVMVRFQPACLDPTHETTKHCSMPADQMVCKFPCKKTLLCGQPCPNKCGEECAVKCNSEFPCKKMLPCNHPCPNKCCELCPIRCKVCDQEEQEKIKLAKAAHSKLVRSSFEEMKLRVKEYCASLNQGAFPKDWRCDFEKPSFNLSKGRTYEVTKDMLAFMQELLDGTMNRHLLGKGVDQIKKGDYSKLQVVKVFRIENPMLWLKYRLCQIKLSQDATLVARTNTELDKDPPLTYDQRWMEAKGLDSSLRETYLFHGTKPNLRQRIMDDGFEERVASLGGLYGAGAYFAEKSNKSDQYTIPDDKGLHYMFIARVLLGAHVKDAKVHENQTRILEEVPAGQGIRYSSLLGLAGYHREFVVYDGSQAYPEYYIQYRRSSS